MNEIGGLLLFPGRAAGLNRFRNHLQLLLVLFGGFFAARGLRGAVLPLDLQLATLLLDRLQLAAIDAPVRELVIIAAALRRLFVLLLREFFRNFSHVGVGGSGAFHFAVGVVPLVALGAANPLLAVHVGILARVVIHLETEIAFLVFAAFFKAVLTKRHFAIVFQLELVIHHSSLLGPRKVQRGAEVVVATLRGFANRAGALPDRGQSLGLGGDLAELSGGSGAREGRGIEFLFRHFSGLFCPFLTLE